jgi:hypothetical protein
MFNEICLMWDCANVRFAKFFLANCSQRQTRNKTLQNAEAVIVMQILYAANYLQWKPWNSVTYVVNNAKWEIWEFNGNKNIILIYHLYRNVGIKMRTGRTKITWQCLCLGAASDKCIHDSGAKHQVQSRAIKYASSHSICEAADWAKKFQDM